MQLFIKHLTGMDIMLNVEPNDTIEEVKTKILDKVGIPPKDEILIYENQELENDKTLQDYSIINDSNIYLFLIINIYVLTFTGETIELRVKPTEQIKDIKFNISNETGILPNQFKLMNSNKELKDDDNQTLYSNGINYSTNIQMVKI